MLIGCFKSIIRCAVDQQARRSDLAGMVALDIDALEVGVGRHVVFAKVETFAECGAVGPGWAPHGLKVSGADGQAVFLSFARTSALVDDGADSELVFDTEVLDVSALRRENVS